MHIIHSHRRHYPVETVIKPLLFTLFVVSALGALNAQTPAWQPSPGHRQIPIWPGTPPDARPAKGPETTEAVTKELVAGKPWLAVENVVRPTMTVYSPTGRNTGVAVVVFPGGGYQDLAIDLEISRVGEKASFDSSAAGYLADLLSLAEEVKLQLDHYVSSKAAIETFVLSWWHLRAATGC